MQIQTSIKTRTWNLSEIAQPMEIRMCSFSGPGNGNHRNKQRIEEVGGGTYAA